MTPTPYDKVRVWVSCTNLLLRVRTHLIFPNSRECACCGPVVGGKGGEIRYVYSPTSRDFASPNFSHRGFTLCTSCYVHFPDTTNGKVPIDTCYFVGTYEEFVNHVIIQAVLIK